MMLSCLLCLIYFNILYSFFEKVVRLTLSNLPIKKCKNYVDLFYLLQDNLWSKITTDHNWHIKQNIEHDFCERTPQIEKLLLFPRKMLVGKAMYIKVTSTNLKLCYTLSGPMACCPFCDCQLLLMLQSLQVKKTSLINPFNNFLAGFVADKQDFCRLNKLVLSTSRLSFFNSKVFDWSWSLL